MNSAANKIRNMVGPFLIPISYRNLAYKLLKKQRLFKAEIGVIRRKIKKLDKLKERLIAMIDKEEENYVVLSNVKKTQLEQAKNKFADLEKTKTRLNKEMVGQQTLVNQKKSPN